MVLVPLLSRVQFACAPVQRAGPIQDTPGVIAGDWDGNGLPLPAPRRAQRWRCSEACLIAKQNDGPRPPFQATLEPPFACRQVGERRAST